MKFIDWFADGSVYVVDLALACFGVESEVAVPATAAVREEIPDGAAIVVFVSGTVTTGLASAVRVTVDELKRNHPVDVVAFGACACAGGPYWDSAGVAAGLPDAGLDADHWIPGCPPGPDALTGFMASSREAA